MGRKRKQIDPEGESKANLPPCRVCDAPGAGFHYGANTCEACKGFFHRSLKINNQYKCEGSGHCVIEHGRSRLCQFCRYNKCLSVGMAKEAIKTGRYTSVKRTSDILEIKRLQAKKKTGTISPHADRPNKIIHNQCMTGSDYGSENSLDCDSQPGQFSSVHGSTVGQISLASVVQIKSEILPSIIPNGTSCLVAPMSQGCPASICAQSLADNILKTETESSSEPITLLDIESLFSESPEDHTHLQAHHVMQHGQALSSTVSPLSVTSPYGSPSEGSFTKPSPNMLTDVASSLLSLSSGTVHSSGPSPSLSTYGPCTASMFLHSPASSVSLNSPATSMMSPGSVNASPASSSTNGTSSSSTSSIMNLEMQMYIADSPNSTSDTWCDVGEMSVAELYADMDVVVKILMDADERYVVPLSGKITDEEIKRQQQEHFEACKLKREMFGQLRRVPDHEYDYVFATTGLDMDDRKKRLHMMGAGLEKVIRAMVKFCKIIPGFSKLDISDKVKLIKYSRQEFGLFTIYKFMNAEKRIMRGLDNHWKCENEWSRMSTDSDALVMAENLSIHFSFCDTLQKLKLSDEELVVIRALVVMAPDRDPHVDSPLAREIHWKLNECLIHVLSKRYSKPLLFYAKIMGKLTEARSQTENMIRYFKKLKIKKYSNVMSNPLLREMCSGIFFDEKDDEGTDLNS